MGSGFSKAFEKKYRATKFGIAPYIEFEFKKEAISHVVLGPSNPLLGKRRTVERMLLGMGYNPSNVAIVDSTASYRS